MVSEPDKVEKEATRIAPGAPAEPVKPGTAARGVRLAGFRGWQTWVGVAALVLAVAVAAWTAPRLSGLQSEAAHRLQAIDQRLASLESLLKQTQDELRDARNRTAVLESRAQDLAGLQAQIEKLYRNLAEDSTDVLLAEIETSLALAGQQLALGSSAQAALAALQELDARLARHNDPGLQPVRRALMNDMDRLKSYPSADVGSLALRVDALSRSIERLPLLSSLAEKRPPPTGMPKRAADAPSADARSRAPAAGPASAPNRAVDAASAGLGALRDEIEQLFRVRRVDTPDAMLVAPDQAYFLRENLRLLLLNVRLSLLSRNEALFRSDVERAIGWLRSYYDADDRAVAHAIAQLRQLSSAQLVLEPPTLAESLAAARAARVARDATR